MTDRDHGEPELPVDVWRALSLLEEVMTSIAETNDADKALIEAHLDKFSDEERQFIEHNLERIKDLLDEIWHLMENDLLVPSETSETEQSQADTPQNTGDLIFAGPHTYLVAVLRIVEQLISVLPHEEDQAVELMSKGIAYYPPSSLPLLKKAAKVAAFMTELTLQVLRKEDGPSEQHDGGG